MAEIGDGYRNVLPQYTWPVDTRGSATAEPAHGGVVEHHGAAAELVEVGGPVTGVLGAVPEHVDLTVVDGGAPVVVEAADAEPADAIVANTGGDPAHVAAAEPAETFVAEPTDRGGLFGLAGFAALSGEDRRDDAAEVDQTKATADPDAEDGAAAEKDETTDDGHDTELDDAPVLPGHASPGGGSAEVVEETDTDDDGQRDTVAADTEDEAGATVVGTDPGTGRELVDVDGDGTADIVAAASTHDGEVSFADRVADGDRVDGGTTAEDETGYGRLIPLSAITAAIGVAEHRRPPTRLAKVGKALGVAALVGLVGVGIAVAIDSMRRGELTDWGWLPWNWGGGGEAQPPVAQPDATTATPPPTEAVPPTEPPVVEPTTPPHPTEANVGVFDGSINPDTGLLRGTADDVLASYAMEIGWTLSDDPDASKGTVDVMSTAFREASDRLLEINGFDPANKGRDLPQGTVLVFQKG